MLVRETAKFICGEIQQNSTHAGLEPTRENPSRFRIYRLNHSANVSFFFLIGTTKFIFNIIARFFKTRSLKRNHHPKTPFHHPSLYLLAKLISFSFNSFLDKFYKDTTSIMGKRKNKGKSKKNANHQQHYKKRKVERYWVEDCVELQPPPTIKPSLVVTISRIELHDDHTHRPESPVDALQGKCSLVEFGQLIPCKSLVQLLVLKLSFFLFGIFLYRVYDCSRCLASLLFQVSIPFSQSSFRIINVCCNHYIVKYHTSLHTVLCVFHVPLLHLVERDMDFFVHSNSSLNITRALLSCSIYFLLIAK